MIFLSGSLDYIGEMLGLVVIFVAILALAYFVTRWLGKNGYNIQKNRNIKVIESYRLNQNNSLYLVKIADKYTALGVSKDRIDYLTEIDEDAVELSNNEAATPSSLFQDILKKHQDKGKE